MKQSVESNEDIFIRNLVEVQGALRGYILAHVANEAQAQDVLQDVSVVLWRKYEQYSPDRPFLNWALGVARYQILNTYRRDSRSRLVFDNELAEKIAERYEALEPGLDERRNALRSCVELLSAEARKLVELRYGSGMSMDRIAGQVGKKINAVTVSLSRIRASLVKCAERATRSGAMEIEGV